MLPKRVHSQRDFTDVLTQWFWLVVRYKPVPCQLRFLNRVSIQSINLQKVLLLRTYDLEVTIKFVYIEIG